MLATLYILHSKMYVWLADSFIVTAKCQRQVLHFAMQNVRTCDLQKSKMSEAGKKEENVSFAKMYGIRKSGANIFLQVNIL